jgi:hypothetical protein
LSPDLAEEDATCRFPVGQLRELVTRSTDASTTFEEQVEPSGIERVVPAAREPTVTSPEFLAKGEAVLLLSDASAIVPRAVPVAMVGEAPTATTPGEVPAATTGEVLATVAYKPYGARAGIEPAILTEVASTVRRRRSAARAPTSARGGFLKRRLLALALLGVVVASQPWWWNVGDLRAHATTSAVRK